MEMFDYTKPEGNSTAKFEQYRHLNHKNITVTSNFILDSLTAPEFGLMFNEFNFTLIEDMDEKKPTIKDLPMMKKFL